MKTCVSKKKDGGPCGRSTKLGQIYCFYHIGTCTAITSKGTKCSNGCMEGTDRSGYHAATCPGITKTGEPCQLAVEFCRYHRFQIANMDTSTNVTTTTAAMTRSSSSSSSLSSLKSGKKQCLGKTQKGTRCRLKVDGEQEYCHFHDIHY